MKDRGACVLQSMGWQRGRHDLTEQQQKWVGLVIMSLIQTDYLWDHQEKLLLSYTRAGVGMGRAGMQLFSMR